MGSSMTLNFGARRKGGACSVHLAERAHSTRRVQRSRWCEVGAGDAAAAVTAVDGKCVLAEGGR